ncbi:MAG TPA: MFS transporter [Microlunatus sp.]|nr:MFS transporter [Microlunatus sp.]
MDGSGQPGQRPAEAARLWLASPGYRSLWSGRTCSYLGDALLLVILLLHLADTTGQALSVALLLLVGDFAPALLGPLTGTISDRFGPKRVMVVCDITQGAAVVLMLLVTEALLPLLILVGVRAVAGQVLLPASRSAVPMVVVDQDLDRANAGLGLGVNMAEIFGPILAAALLSALDVQTALVVTAAVFGMSALLVSTLPALPPVADTEDETVGLLAAARSGLAFVWSTSLVKIIIVGFVGTVVFNGIDDVALVFLAVDVLGGSTAQAGLLYAAVGVGLVAGFLALSTARVRVPMVPLLVIGLAVCSAGNLLTGLAGAVAVAFTWQAVRGIGIAAVDVAVSTLLQRTVPPAMLGRTFGNLYGAVGLAAGLSYVLGGLALNVTSARIVFVVAGAGGLLVTATTAAVLLRHTRMHHPNDGVGEVTR